MLKDKSPTLLYLGIVWLAALTIFFFLNRPVNAGELIWTDCTITGTPPHTDDGANADHCGLIDRDNLDQWYASLAKRTQYAKYRYWLIKRGK